ncbi:MAG: hypothetical protein OIF58_10640 [Cohaesibacter sp.]|nr:hypothetical protein [Cohaesibacter sp.]
MQSFKALHILVGNKALKSIALVWVKGVASGFVASRKVGAGAWLVLRMSHALMIGRDGWITLHGAG